MDGDRRWGTRAGARARADGGLLRRAGCDDCVCARARPRSPRPATRAPSGARRVDCGDACADPMELPPLQRCCQLSTAGDVGASRRAPGVTACGRPRCVWRRPWCAAVGGPPLVDHAVACLGRGPVAGVVVGAVDVCVVASPALEGSCSGAGQWLLPRVAARVEGPALARRGLVSLQIEQRRWAEDPRVTWCSRSRCGLQARRRWGRPSQLLPAARLPAARCGQSTGNPDMLRRRARDRAVSADSTMCFLTPPPWLLLSVVVVWRRRARAPTTQGVLG